MAPDPAVVAEAYRAAKAAGASDKIMLALFEAGLVESGFRNLNHGDRDSVGFLQQRPSQGWPQPMNVTVATQSFVSRAKTRDRPYMTPGMLAQAVQRSAFPLKYDAVYPAARVLLDKAKGGFGFDDLTLTDEAALASGAAQGELQGAANALGEGVVTLKKAGEWLGNRDNWIRVAKVTAGLGMVYVGLAMIVIPRTGGKVAGAIGVLPIGKAAKAAGAVAGKVSTSTAA